MKQIKEWEDLHNLRVGKISLECYNNNVPHVSVYNNGDCIDAIVIEKGYPRYMTLADAIPYLKRYGFDICLAPQYTAEQLKHIHAAKLTGFDWAAKDDDGEIYGFTSKPYKEKLGVWWSGGGEVDTKLLHNPIWHTIVTSTDEPFELFGEGENHA